MPDTDDESSHARQADSAPCTLLPQLVTMSHMSQSETGLGPTVSSQPADISAPHCMMHLSPSAAQQSPHNLPAESQSAKKTRWSCSSTLCKIEQQSMHGINDLLQKLASTTSARCLHFYLSIDKCLYTDKNPDKLGHSLSCSADNGCLSLLKHLCTVSCHFPAARCMVVATYKLLRLSR